MIQAVVSSRSMNPSLLLSLNLETAPSLDDPVRLLPGVAVPVRSPIYSSFANLPVFILVDVLDGLGDDNISHVLCVFGMQEVLELLLVELLRPGPGLP